MGILMTALRSVGITVPTPEMMYQIESVLRLARPNATIKDIVTWERIINGQIQAANGENEVAEKEPGKVESVDEDEQYLGILPDFIYWPEDMTWQWFAVDFSGACFFYSNKPEMNEEGQVWMLSNFDDASFFDNNIGETPHWQNTLTKRPGNE